MSGLSGWKDENHLKKDLAKNTIPFMHQKLLASASPDDHPPYTNTRRSLLSVLSAKKGQKL